MNLEELVIKRYTDNTKIKEGYYLRIRETNGTKDIKVYYGGIKIFDVVQGKLIVNTSIFIPNSKNVFKNDKFIDKYEKIPTNVLEDMKMLDQYFDIYIGSYASGEARKGYKLDLKFADALRNASEQELNKIKEYLSSSVNKFNDLFSAIELGKLVKSKNDENEESVYKRNRILLFLNQSVVSRKIKFKIKMTELYPVIIWLLKGVLNDWIEDDGNRYFQAPLLNIKAELKDDINFDLSSIEKVLERRVNVYTGKTNNENDYNTTKSSDNQEKQFQQDFMVKFNCNEKEEYTYKDKNGEIKKLYSKNIYPFELEYFMYAGRQKEDEDEDDIDDERTSKNIKGRIDNTFIDGSVAMLVEIKYGIGVIDKTNGIHKHLIDLYSCLNMNKDFILKEYQERVNFRRKVLGLDDNVSLDNIKYDIVCIYNKDVPDTSNLSKKAVKDKIDSIYNVNCIKAGIGKVKTCNGKEHDTICKNVNCYCKNILKKNVPELISMLNEEGINCEVRILLVDNEFNEFEEYSF